MVSEKHIIERALHALRANLFRRGSTNTVLYRFLALQIDVHNICPGVRPSITAVLRADWAEIECRILAASEFKPSGKPPLAPFMPMGLLEQVDEAVRSKYAKQANVCSVAILGLVVHDMLYGTTRRPPRADDRSVGQVPSSRWSREVDL